MPKLAVHGDIINFCSYTLDTGKSQTGLYGIWIGWDMTPLFLYAHLAWDDVGPYSSISCSNHEYLPKL